MATAHPEIKFGLIANFPNYDYVGTTCYWNDATKCGRPFAGSGYADVLDTQMTIVQAAGQSLTFLHVERRVAVLLYPDHVSQYFGTAVLAFPPRPVRAHLEVTRAGTFSRIATAFGAQDLEVGVATFDAAFVVKSTDVATARRLLPPALCAELLALEAQFLGYDDGSEPQHSAHAMVEISGVVTDAAVLDRAIRAMTAFARTA